MVLYYRVVPLSVSRMETGEWERNCHAIPRWIDADEKLYFKVFSILSCAERGNIEFEASQDSIRRSYPTFVNMWTRHFRRYCCVN